MTRRSPHDGRMTICFDIWSAIPVFHQWADYDNERGGAVTNCGRLMDPDHWRLVRLRRDHAQNIGRPCQPCLKKGMAWRYRVQTTHTNWSHA